MTPLNGRRSTPWEIEVEITAGRDYHPETKLPKEMVENSKTYTWITVWSAVCLPIILWDASYIFFRSAVSHPFRFPTLTLVLQPEVHAWRGSSLDLDGVRDLPGG